MTKFSLRHISFLLCFFIGVMAMAADRKSGQVVGKIIDAEQNVPVAGALVQIIGDSSLACKSDSLGHYIIENVDVGYNILQVEADGYEFGHNRVFRRVNGSSGGCRYKAACHYRQGIVGNYSYGIALQGRR